MDFNFSLLRTLLLIGCLAALWYAGGFRYPIEPETMVGERTVGESWVMAHLLFVVGAASFALIDHRVGGSSGVNLRLLYALGGLAMMVVAVFWLSSLEKLVPVMPVS